MPVYTSQTYVGYLLHNCGFDILPVALAMILQISSRVNLQYYHVMSLIKVDLNSRNMPFSIII